MRLSDALCSILADVDHLDSPRCHRHEIIVSGEDDALLDRSEGEITRIIDGAAQPRRNFDRPFHVFTEERYDGESTPVDVPSRLEEVASPESPRMLKGVQDLVRKDRRDAERHNPFEEVRLQTDRFVTVLFFEEPLHGNASIQHDE